MYRVVEFGHLVASSNTYFRGKFYLNFCFVVQRYQSCYGL